MDTNEAVLALNANKKERKVRINLTFQMDLPLPTTRKLEPINMVAPYIDDCAIDMQRAMGIMKHGEVEEWKKQAAFTPETFEYIQSLVDGKVDDRAREQENIRAAKQHAEWVTSQEEMCRRLYNMSWDEVRTMSWDALQKLRDQHNVIWLDGKWQKRAWANR